MCAITRAIITLRIQVWLLRASHHQAPSLQCGQFDGTHIVGHFRYFPLFAFAVSNSMQSAVITAFPIPIESRGNSRFKVKT